MSQTQQTPTLPATGFLRLKEVLQFIPLRRTAWYEGIKQGKFPKPVKCGRASLYRAEDIVALIRRIGNGGMA